MQVARYTIWTTSLPPPAPSNGRSRPCTDRNPTGGEFWCSGKHHQHGAKVQVLYDPTGCPVWVSAASPGSTHDITAARRFVLSELDHAAAAGLPT